MKTTLLLFILLSSCSGLMSPSPSIRGKANYSFVDGSGRFGYSREHRLLKNKLISRVQMSSTLGNSGKPLEKSVAVSDIGTIKEGRNRTLVVRPFASEFTVWLDGKKYSSKMKLDPKSKSMLIDLESPEAKWKGRSSIPFPSGKQFCFFSQIPECLNHSLYLTRARDKKGEILAFYVIWDNYPYTQELFTGVGDKLFSPAVVKFEGEVRGQLNYQVDINGQTLVYHFSKSLDLVRMLWISQGISLIPPSEEAAMGSEE